MQVPLKVQDALTVARRARENAHAPYSKFRVGAALKLAGVDDVVGGCNVENASYGATVCAERTAVLSAVADHGRREFEFLIVAVPGPDVTPPCALCLQVLAEFATDDLEIYLATSAGILERHRLGDLLPRAFRSFVPETRG